MISKLKRHTRHRHLSRRLVNSRSVRRRSEAFAEQRSLAFGVHEVFGARVRKAGVQKRSKVFGSVQRRSTKVGLSAISDGLGWPWDDPPGRYSCAVFLLSKNTHAIIRDRRRS